MCYLFMYLQEVLECPAGKYCPAGSVSPVSCPAGTYNLLPQAESADRCETCPAGYVCTAGTADYSQWPCPIGYFCPEGSAMASPCAPGTYGVTSKATLAEECQQCPPGTSCSRLCHIFHMLAQCCFFTLSVSEVKLISALLGGEVLYSMDVRQILALPCLFYPPNVQGTSAKVQTPRRHRARRDSFVSRVPHSSSLVLLVATALQL